MNKKMGIKYENNINNGCYDCRNCIAFGEGDYICQNTRAMVIEDYEPTEDFYKCNEAGFCLINEIG